LKIVHLYGGGDTGGATTHLMSLLGGLKSKADILLVCLRRGEFYERAKAIGIPATVISSGNPLRDFGELKKLLKKEKCDIVHCHGSKANMLGVLLQLFTSAAAVTTIHSDYRKDYLGRPLANLTFGTINRISMRLIKNHIGVSQPVSDFLVTRGFRQRSVFTIYNGLDFSTDKADFDRDKYLNSLGITLDENDILCGIAARLDPVKDIPTLLRALAKLPDNMKLIIAGEGAQEAELRALCSTLGIDRRVFFVGWLSEMDPFYRAIDINLLTSLSETFPYAVTEGARWKKATVCSRVGGIPMLIAHGVGGYLFEPGDVQALTDCLAALGADPALRSAFGSRLYERASRDFSVEAMTDRQLAIYETILRRRLVSGRQGVTICGSYGRGNAGDDAILEAITAELRSIDPDMPIRVLSRKPLQTKLKYHTEALYTFNIFSFIHALLRSAVYINGGGNLIQDVTSTRSLLFYLYTLRCAKLCGCKVMMYGCGIGPVDKKLDRLLAGRTIRRCADVITLREESSLEELEKLGVTGSKGPKIILSADPALTLSPASSDEVDSAMLSAGLHPEGNYICFALRRWPIFEEKTAAFAEAAQYAYQKYGLTPVFIPIEMAQDTSAAQAVADTLTCPHHIFSSVPGSGLVIGLLSRMRAVVSMRLHGLIFASGQGVPLVGIAYDMKVSAFLKYMGQNLCIKIEDLDAPSLFSLIDRAMQLDRSELLTAVDQLRAIERRNVDTVRSLLSNKE